eukprot:COSAG01_NODE_2397_length_7771_cov_12.578076_2_plen_81_part_00
MGGGLCIGAQASNAEQAVREREKEALWEQEGEQQPIDEEERRVLESMGWQPAASTASASTASAAASTASAAAATAGGSGQ